MNFIGNTVTLFILINLLNSILFICFGTALYLLNKTEKDKKTYGKKIIVNGIIGFILAFIIYFIISVTAGMIGICLHNLEGGLPSGGRLRIPIGVLHKKQLKSNWKSMLNS